MFNENTPIEKLELSALSGLDVELWLKRDDLIHEEISGNKWRKLKLNIEKAKAGKYDGILTFGGAYSNHISATAAAGKALGIVTIGIIRGEELHAESNETLRNAAANGMQLVFVTREEYSWRYEKDYEYSLRNRFGNVLVIGEGGANFHGVMGCTEIVAELDNEPDYFILPAGTGTTAAGILMAAEKAKVIAVPVFKKGDFIRDEIRELLYYAGLDDETIEEKLAQLKLATDYHFGGYGKFTPELIAFLNETHKKTGIELDQIYTGKMFYTLCDWVNKGLIAPESSVVAIHTGGLQGTSSIREQLIY